MAPTRAARHRCAASPQTATLKAEGAAQRQPRRRCGIGIGQRGRRHAARPVHVNRVAARWVARQRAARRLAFAHDDGDDASRGLGAHQRLGRVVRHVHQVRGHWPPGAKAAASRRGWRRPHVRGAVHVDAVVGACAAGRAHVQVHFECGGADVGGGHHLRVAAVARHKRVEVDAGPGKRTAAATHTRDPQRWRRPQYPHADFVDVHAQGAVHGQHKVDNVLVKAFRRKPDDELAPGRGLVVPVQ